MVGKGDRGHDQADGITGYAAQLLHAVVIDCGEVFALDLHAVHSYCSGKAINGGLVVQPVFFHDLAHLRLQIVMLLPLLPERVPDRLLGLHEDDVDNDRLRL